MATVLTLLRDVHSPFHDALIREFENYSSCVALLETGYFRRRRTSLRFLLLLLRSLPSSSSPDGLPTDQLLDAEGSGGTFPSGSPDGYAPVDADERPEGTGESADGILTGDPEICPSPVFNSSKRRRDYPPRNPNIQKLYRAILSDIRKSSSRR